MTDLLKTELHLHFILKISENSLVNAQDGVNSVLKLNSSCK